MLSSAGFASPALRWSYLYNTIFRAQREWESQPGESSGFQWDDLTRNFWCSRAVTKDDGIELSIWQHSNTAAKTTEGTRLLGDNGGLPAELNKEQSEFPLIREF
jgi:hypothetical protein